MVTYCIPISYYVKPMLAYVISMLLHIFCGILYSAFITYYVHGMPHMKNMISTVQWCKGQVLRFVYSDQVKWLLSLFFFKTCLPFLTCLTTMNFSNGNLTSCVLTEIVLLQGVKELKYIVGQSGLTVPHYVPYVQRYKCYLYSS